jgi:hypothetical protein
MELCEFGAITDIMRQDVRFSDAQIAYILAQTTRGTATAAGAITGHL